ncbi:NADH:flavin oxidoreductase [Nocardioides sp. HDW12B]|uniref:oxidoreductase n=1 Tax=Nocardioides sp. HDW12B TaxID=2714939 RepID=UPI001407E65E|nr:NADH:flavin oxidoreductase [Nocardioides sp. HDW12B]QIK65060.1 NADH:flavin oxidoreductase [Nocardioides sp. HDW12B]
MAVPDVFSAVGLGPVRLRNRVVKAATFEGRTPDGVVTDELVDFHATVARGGAAMTTVAYLAVSPEGRTHAAQVQLREESLEGLRRLTDAVHGAGGAVAAQVGHAGPVANGRSNGARALSATAMPSPLSMQMVRRAGEADLTRITHDYVRGARLAVRAGFDALELHLGHGYLLSSFLSPLTNRRTDARGGSLAHRASYPREVVRAVRDEVGDEVAVYAKLGMTDGVRGGLGVDEALDVASMLEDDGCLDALQLTAGSSLLNPMYLFRGGAPLRELTAQMPFPVRWGMRTVGRGFLKEYPYEELFLLPHARRFRERLSLPLMLLGGISTRASLDRAMAEGFAYAVMGRALLREPDLVDRMRTEGLTRSTCIHCNRCMPTIYTGTRCVLDDPEQLRLTTRPARPGQQGARA